MRAWVLGSGSRGNAVLLECGDTRLLVDAGFAPRELAQRLARIGVVPQSIEACVVTHEHSDHVKGASAAAQRWGWALYATAGTAAACPALAEADARTVEAGATFAVGCLDVRSAPTSHDAADPVAIVATARPTGARVAVCYDLGVATDPVRQSLRDVDVLILESNHDEILLRESPYPWSVKARIGGSHGHLSNRAAAELVRELHHEGLCAVVLAHLSEQANDPGLAHDTVGEALGRRYRGTLQVAVQEKPLDPIDVSRIKTARLPVQTNLF